MKRGLKIPADKTTRDSGITLVIMAAGQSRRYSGGKGQLKQLEGFGPHEEPILFYTIFDAWNSGIRRAVLVISDENRAQFEQKVVRPWAGKVAVELVAQRQDDLPVIAFNGPGPVARSKPWGTGHAVWAARHEVPGPFILANADDFYGRQAIGGVATHLKQMMSADHYYLQAYDLMETLPADHPDTGYNRGFCQVDQQGSLVSLQEKLGIHRDQVKDPEQWVSMNLWGLGQGVFGLLEEQFQAFLAEQGHDRQQEFFLPDALSAGMARGQARIKVLPPAGRWLGVTHPEDGDRIRGELRKLHESGEYPEDMLV